MTKEIVAGALDGMPEEFHLDELFERLIFIKEIEEARKEIKEGKTITHEEMGRRSLEWRK